jgi:NRPS condensation-like uncharacterized protein
VTTVPLNLLDELFLDLDQAREPWGVHFEVRVSGALDPERLAEAVRAATRRHPIARARLARWRPTDRAYRWEVADRVDDVPLTVVPAADDRALAAVREHLYAVSPSLDAPPPFVVVLARGPRGDALLLNLHHAAGDGISAARLMRSILRAYAGEDDPTPDLDTLIGRDVLALVRANSLEDRRLRRRALARQAMRGLTPVARLARDGGRDRPGYGFALLELTEEQTRAAFARRVAGTTINDVLLAALAVAVRRWNAEHGVRPGRVALTMPVNLRPEAWREEVVANYASYVTVSLGAGDHADLDRALAATGERTRRIKGERLAGLVVDLLVGPSALQIGAKQRLQDVIPLSGDVVVDTASLSNLGALDGWPAVDGGGSVEAVWFSPPGRMPLGAAMGVATVGGRLDVTLRHPRAQFDAAAAEAFVRTYRDVLLG